MLTGTGIFFLIFRKQKGTLGLLFKIRLSASSYFIFYPFWALLPFSFSPCAIFPLLSLFSLRMRIISYLCTLVTPTYFSPLFFFFVTARDGRHRYTTYGIFLYSCSPFSSPPLGIKRCCIVNLLVFTIACIWFLQL